MKRLTYTNNTLLVIDVRNPGQPEWRVQRNGANKRAGENIPEQKIKLALSATEPVQNTVEPEKTRLSIKNMVSISCIIVVKALLDNLGLKYTAVELGVADIVGTTSDANYKELKSTLHYFGFELMEDRKNILVERIKNVIIDMIHYKEELPNIKISSYLHQKMNYEFSYAYLSSLFTEVTHTTIEHYIIKNKIEHAKEMIVYNSDLTLSEIAWKLQYSSVAHLSAQFKRVTGYTPSYFKSLEHKALTPLQHL